MRSCALCGRGNGPEEIFRGFIGTGGKSVIVKCRTGPIGRVITVTRVSAPSSKRRVYFGGIRSLRCPVSCTSFGSTPRLGDVRFVRGGGNSLFGITPSRCRCLVSLVERSGPGRRGGRLGPCARRGFLGRMCVDRRSCAGLHLLLRGGGGVVLRKTPNMNGAFSTGELTCSVVKSVSRSEVRFVRFRRGCDCRSFVVKCQPGRSNKFRLGGKIFCGFYGETRDGPSGSCCFVVSRVGHKGLDGVFNRLLVLVRGSCQSARVGLTCGNRVFYIPDGLCVVNVVGATSQDLTVVSCTLHHQFDFCRVAPKFSARNFGGCRRSVKGSGFSDIIGTVISLGRSVAGSSSLNSKFYVNRDCFYSSGPGSVGSL